MRPIFAIFIILSFFCPPAPAADRVMPVDEAYGLLRQNGSLADVNIKQPFDLSAVAMVNASSATVRPQFTFEKVIFNGGLNTRGQTIDAHLRFVNCRFDSIEAEETTWLGDVNFENGHITHSANFQKNEFRSALRFHYLNFRDEAWFTHSRFTSTAEFLHCIWNYKARFSDTTFFKAAKFNFSTVRERAVFQAAVFENDVSFVKFNDQYEEDDPLNADFLNVLFKGDAEFRFCKFNHVQFSKGEYISVFYKLADFRGCDIGSARFDYAEFMGVANFVQAKFGNGGVSFENAGISGSLMNLDGIECGGPMILSGPYIPSLHFRWSEIESAVLMANPGAADLELLWNRELALGRTREALKLEYFKSKSADRKVWSDPGARPVERAWAMFQWIAWGWPTGYGTRFGRILLIAMICWIFCAIPSLSRRGLLVQVPVVRNRFSQKNQANEGPPLPLQSSLPGPIAGRGRGSRIQIQTIVFGIVLYFWAHVQGRGQKRGVSGTFASSRTSRFRKLLLGRLAIRLGFAGIDGFHPCQHQSGSAKNHRRDHDLRMFFCSISLTTVDIPFGPDFFFYSVSAGMKSKTNATRTRILHKSTASGQKTASLSK